MNKEEESSLAQETKQKFEKAKKELGFKSSFQDIESIFFIQDFMMSEGYVSDNFSRQMCARIRDTLNVWANYIHSLLMPNPSYLINMTEAKLFVEAEKKELWDLMREALALNSANTLSGLTKDKKLEAEYIDGAVAFWKNKYQPGLVKIMKKVNKAWKE